MNDSAITLQTLPAQPVAVMRSIRSVPQIAPWISAAFDEVAAVVASHDGGPAGPPFARFHERGDNVFEIEAGFPCSEPITGHGFVEASALPGGPVASTMYVGPYDGIGVRPMMCSARGSRPTTGEWWVIRGRSISTAQTASRMGRTVVPRSSSPSQAR